MKRIPRDPLRFDTFALFAHHLQQAKLPLNHRAALRRFIDNIKASTKASLASPTFLHGQRTEALFEMVVATLGQVKLLKREDEGDVFHKLPHAIRPPDFRLLLADDTQALAEVKNYHQKGGFEPQTFKSDYVMELTAYAHAMRCELFFATYWARWSTWTLVREHHLAHTGGQRSLTFKKAIAVNEMALVGDLSVASRAPLRFRVETKPISGAQLTRKGRPARRQKQLLEIQSVGIYSDHGRITDPTELRIAAFLMFYGRWQEGEQRVETDEHGGIVAVEIPVEPDPESSQQEKQGFDVVGTLSGMLSRLYHHKTMRKGRIAGVRTDFEPGEYTNLIPPDFDYSRSVLPLWVFQMQPNANFTE
ncbi:hypothetical protein [Hyalangium rubrum]|uniref:Restriction endonuclease n=1 Tax=Hyalangium rubrum TaxID=3103134 RepID=A0ABU5H8N5_9BACT|nr:hypothetical protein [Hyalangium sp. s54d21]MDY7229848.1 hypothetical protein [Hyalangium sp. s54d21]